MDNNNWRSAPPGHPQGQVGGGKVPAVPNFAPPAAMDAGDWRNQLQADSRKRIVNKIMDTLTRHLPHSGQEGLQELKKIAIRLEDKVYTDARNQSDYLRKISMKVLTMETRSQPHQDYLDSKGIVNFVDWQGEVYQKIKSTKDKYFLQLNDVFVKIATKLQEHDSLHQQPIRKEPLEKLRYYKVMLDRLLGFLQMKKSDVQNTHRVKLPAVERQILNILDSNRPRRTVPLQQGQLPHLQMAAVVQHSELQSQISQMPPQENQMNSQMQPMNLQSSATKIQPNCFFANLQQNSLSSVQPVSGSQKNMSSGEAQSTFLDMGQNIGLNL